MISECTRDMQNGIIDIFVLYDKSDLIGELHVMYQSDDEILLRKQEEYQGDKYEYNLYLMR